MMGQRYQTFVRKQSMGPGVLADTAYCPKKNEAFLERGMFKGNIDQRRMPRRPLPDQIARAIARRSAVRPAVEHVFTGQKRCIALVIRTIGTASARIRSVWRIRPIISSASLGSRGEVRLPSRKTRRRATHGATKPRKCG